MSILHTPHVVSIRSPALYPGAHLPTASTMTKRRLSGLEPYSPLQMTSTSRSSSPSDSSMIHVGAKKSSRSRSSIQPLRRGDACLMCRAKKLVRLRCARRMRLTVQKCSATKPVCDQCAKRKDRCVYDGVRPASRVEKLERKLAELEEQELRAVLSSRRHSTAEVFPTSTYDFQPNHFSSNSMGNIDVSNFSFPPPNVTLTASTTRSSTSVPAPARPSSMPSAQMAALSNWQWPGNDYAGVAPIHTEVQVPTMPWSLISTSNDISTAWNGDMSMALNSTGLHSTAMDATAMNHDNPFAFDATAFQNPAVDPSILIPTDLSASTEALFDSGAIAQSTFINPPMAALVGDVPMDAQQTIDDVLAQAATQMPVINEKDVSQSARDYLLDLFFCPPRTPFGPEPYTEQHFRAKMNGPVEHRPHPALLFSMYTVAASSSYIPAVRALADSLYIMARDRVEEAIVAEDRLVDAINGGKMLSKWLFSRARALEGYQMSNKIMSVALACHLHRIRSSVWDPSEVGPRFDHVWPLIGPPRNQWDLTERIHAFWSIWASDCGATLMMPWPSAIDDRTILTPLPKRPGEAPNSSQDFSLRSLYKMASDPTIRTPDNVYALLYASAHLCHRAKALREARPEAALGFAEQAEFGPDHTYCARRDHPRAYKEIMEAARSLRERLPDHLQIKYGAAQPWPDPDVPVVHVCILAAQAYLHNIFGDEYDRESCLAFSRESANIIRIWFQHSRLTEEQTKGSRSNRNKNGIAAPYALAAWFWTADRLMRGAKVVKALGREDEAAKLLEDGNAVVDGLKSMGVMYGATADKLNGLSNGN